MRQQCAHKHARENKRGVKTIAMVKSRDKYEEEEKKKNSWIMFYIVSCQGNLKAV